MITKYNAPWHPLKSVILGKSYSENFYADIKNIKIRETLQKIARETEEDYKNIQKTLESLNVKVFRPDIAESSIMDWIDYDGKINYSTASSCTLIPRPPMHPRDSQLIVGDEMYATTNEINYYDNIFNVQDLKLVPNDRQFDAPMVTVIGDTLIVDTQDLPWLGNYVKSLFPNKKITAISVGGHNDAVYAPLLPGVLLSTHYKSSYSESFPDWEVYHIENQSWDALPEWRQFKHSNQTKWWMPGEEKNEEFNNFVGTWMEHWLGYVAETVFDVNLLMVDTKTVLVNNYHKGVFDFLKKHNIEPIIAPFRHRFFWDGGIHCITSDLYREGESENYIKN